MIESGQTAEYLSQLTFPGESLLSRVKLKYRPYICPLDQILNLIPAGRSICDIGCGEGIFLLLAKNFCGPAKIAGLDIDSNAINAARARFSNIQPAVRIETYEGIILPEWVRGFDFFTMIDVLHHVPSDNQKNYVFSVIDQMKPGAYLLLKDICGAELPWVWFNKLHDLIVAKQIGHERSSGEIASWLSESPVKVEVVAFGRKRTIVYPHYWFLIKKI